MLRVRTQHERETATMKTQLSSAVKQASRIARDVLNINASEVANVRAGELDAIYSLADSAFALSFTFGLAGETVSEYEYSLASHVLSPALFASDNAGVKLDDETARTLIDDYALHFMIVSDADAGTYRECDSDSDARVILRQVREHSTTRRLAMPADASSAS